MFTKSGYVINVYGQMNEKNVIFSETKPSVAEIEELVKDCGGKKAFVSQVDMFLISDNYEDKNGNIIEIDNKTTVK